MLILRLLQDSSFELNDYIIINNLHAFVPHPISKIGKCRVKLVGFL